jgi:hypothetical protein
MIDWRAALEQVAPVAGDKRMALAEAVRRFVQPGMTLNPVALQARPVAALYELICRFAGGDPRLELVSPSLSGNYLQLVGRKSSRGRCSPSRGRATRARATTKLQRRASSTPNGPSSGREAEALSSMENA